MTAVSINVLRGAANNKPSDFTLGTTGPASGQDVMVAYNLLDQNSNALTRQDVILALQAVIYAMESGKPFLSTAVNGTDFVGPQI